MSPLYNGLYMYGGFTSTLCTGVPCFTGITKKDEENDDINTVPKQQINQEANPVVDASSSSIEDKV